MQALHAYHGSTKQQQQHDNSSSNDSTARPRLSSAELLQYLPLPGEVTNPFMAEAAAGMLQLLQNKKCVLAASGELVKASDTLLPSPLLTSADGQQLISNAWLQQGLPETQYVHPDLLAGNNSSSNSRAEQVLLQLGSEHFSASLLVQWLTAPNTRQLLEALTPAQRVSWLQDLYSCLSKLKLQPAGSPMCMANSSSWGRRLATAPILQLHGSQQLVSCNHLQDKLYLWSSAFGGEAALCLFSSGSSSGGGGSNSSSISSSSGSLHFVDPCTLTYDTRSMLHSLLQLPVVPMSVLVEELLRQQQQQQRKGLQQQEAQEAVHKQNERMLLFLMSNFKHLGSSELQQLRQRVLLRAGKRGSHVLASNPHLPLDVSSSRSAVPAELQPDLVQAGLQFLHSSYQHLAAAAAADSAGDLWQLIKSLGVREVTTDAAAQKLLQLYTNDSSRRSVHLEQHMRHVSFLTSASDLSLMTCNNIRNGQLRLYSSCQDPSQESPEVMLEFVHWPLSGIAAGETAAAITVQLQRGCGLLFVHSCYCSSAGIEDTAHGRLMRCGVQEAGPNEVGIAGRTGKQYAQQLCTPWQLCPLTSLQDNIQHALLVKGRGASGAASDNVDTPHSLCDTLYDGVCNHCGLCCFAACRWCHNCCR
jgi:hypothetical protein